MEPSKEGGLAKLFLLVEECRIGLRNPDVIKNSGADV